MFFLSLLLGITAAAAEVLGGMLLVSRGRWPERVQVTMLALGAGFILALVFLKVLPESWDAVGSEAAVAMLAGFGTLHFFEHAVVGHLHFGEETHKEAMASRIAGLSAFSGLFIHAFFDGLSISVSVHFDLFLGLLVFFAVLLHKFPEGLTIGSIMLSAGFSRAAVIRAAVGIGLATVIGAATMSILPSIDQQWMGRILAFSAGTVLYVGATDLIPEINKCEERMPPLMVFVGIALFYLSERLLAALIGH
ncbi:MAG: ZIP family metal transporter [Bacteroidota bacterium]